MGRRIGLLEAAVGSRRGVKLKIAQIAAILMMLVCADIASADLFYSDTFSFSGSWSRYTTLSDAQNHTNATGGGALSSQPYTLYFDGTKANNIFQTAFYAQPPGALFVGAYDPTASTLSPGTSVFFNSANHSANIIQSGSTTDGTSRFDATGLLPVAASGGDWVSYSFSATALGIIFPNISLTPPFESDSNPTAVSGSFAGIFHNTGAGGPGGFFDVNLTATHGGARATGQAINPTDVFISSSVGVPEPGTVCLSLALLGAVSVKTFRRRR